MIQLGGERLSVPDCLVYAKGWKVVYIKGTKISRGPSAQENRPLLLAEKQLVNVYTARWQKIPNPPPCIKRPKHCILANFVWVRSKT